MNKSKYKQERTAYKEEVNSFTTWLQKKDYAHDTIRANGNYAAYYLEWLTSNQVHTTEATYTDLLAYIDHCTGKGDGKALLNRKLLAIRKYYDYLLYTGKAVKNPATGLFIRNKHHTVPSNLLTIEELNALYEDYQVVDLRSQRNKVMTGLLVYQAVTREELGKLEITDVKLSTGKITIPGGKHSNPRILQLESSQMLDLQEYLTITRPAIVSKECFYGTGRRPVKINRDKVKNQLFTSMYGSDDVKCSFMYLIRGLRLTHPKVTNGQQIRQSVIANWLKTKNLRVAQYMAGHRCVSSTERYQVNNLEDLQQQLEKLHPLNYL